MNWRTTLVLAIIAIGIGVYIRFYEVKTPTTQEAQRQARNVVNFNKDKVTGLTIQNGDDKIDLRKIDNKWRLEAPIKDQADASLINNLLFDLESWQKDSTITAKEIEADKNKLGEFGLTKPKLRLKLTGEGTPPEIFLGKDAAFEGKMYVRFETSRETYLADQSVRKAIEKKADDFRDKKLTDLIAAQVTRLVLKTPTGEMELEKKGDHWEIVKPLRARGDDQKIGDLIAQITTAHIQQFVADDRGDLRPYGLAEPHGSVTLFGENDKQGQMLQVGGAAKEKDQIYVRFSPRAFVYTVPKKVEDVLNAKPNDLRDRHLARIDEKILDRITIDAPGKGKTVLARKNENWSIASLKNVPAESAEVRRLIDTVRDEPITRFVEDVASNLPKYGLDKPQLQLTFSSFASENTAETKAGEQPFAVISFGKVEGNEVYARVGEEPFVVAVQRTVLDNIFTDPSRWQDLSVFSFKPEQVHHLSVVTDKELSLVHGAKNKWTWQKGEGTINQAGVNSLLNSLSILRAVHWAGATTPQHGFDKPLLVITFTTSPDDKAAHKFMVGAAAENGWFARTDERDGTFVISAPALNALKTPLVQAPTPSPSPSVSASPLVKP
jgi:Domain of unknown function (DUF4340)